MALADYLTTKYLRKRAGAQSYQRGMSYYRQNRVRLEDVSSDRVRARVLGTRLYWVNFWENEGQLEAMCTCPYAEQGHFCKHLVAVGLAAAERFPQSRPAHKSWSERIRELVYGSLPASRPQIGRYAVVFGLRERHYRMGRRWDLVAYRVEKLGRLNGADAIYAKLSSHAQGFSNTPYSLESVNEQLNVEDCVNGPEIGALAQAISLSPTVKDNPQSVSRWLITFTSLTKPVLLFAEEDGNTFGRRLQFHPQKFEFQLELVRENSQVFLNAQLRSEDGVLTWAADEMEVVAWGRDVLWVMRGENLLRVTSNGVSPAKFYDWIKVPQVTIPSDKIEEFLNSYYRQIKNSIHLVGDLPAWRKIDAPTVKRLYLTDAGGELIVHLRFGYEAYEFDYSEYAARTVLQVSQEEWALVQIYRNLALETTIYGDISSAAHGLKHGTSYGENVFLLRAHVTPVEFLLVCVPLLTKDGFEIFGEEDLRIAKVNRSKPTLSLRVSSEIDWFDVQAVVEFGEIEVDLEEVRRALRKKKAYVKLADGSVGEIPAEWVARYKHLFGMGEQTEGGARFSRHHLTLIDQLLEEADQAQADAEFSRRRRKLLEFTSIERKALPDGFRGELRPYQKAGYNWLHFLHEYRFGGVLADDMGLGKTIETLALIQSLRENGHTEKADLLILPRSLLVNWQREAESFTPRLKVHFHYGPNRQVDANIFDKHDLVLTTYGTMRSDVVQLREYPFHYVVLDESQAIKNPQTKTAKAARLLQCDHRLALTGTPVENTTLELWSQFAFLNPGLLGNLSYFKREFARPIENDGDEDTAQLLQKMVYPFILRRTKKQVAPELPPRTERILYTDMEPAQRKFYDRTRDYYRAKLLGLIEDEGFDKA
ncbi:MAG: SNF2-related protein, partial [Chloroflexota bacterium]|nr:SNF2-related protein [Chloroflexota bacterium]